MKFHAKLYKREKDHTVYGINFPFQEFAWKTEMMILSFKIHVNNIQQFSINIQKLKGKNKKKNRKVCRETPNMPIAVCLLFKLSCSRLFGEVLHLKHKVNYHLRRRAHPFSFLIINQSSSGKKENIERGGRKN